MEEDDVFCCVVCILHSPTGAGLSWASLSWGRCLLSESSPFLPLLPCNPELEVLLEVRLLELLAVARRVCA